MHNFVYILCWFTLAISVITQFFSKKREEYFDIQLFTAPFLIAYIVSFHFHIDSFLN